MGHLLAFIIGIFVFIWVCKLIWWICGIIFRLVFALVLFISFIYAAIFIARILIGMVNFYRVY